MPTNRSTLRTMVQRRIGDTSSTTFYSTAFYNDIIDSRVRTWSGVIAQLAPNYYIEMTTVTGVDDADVSDYEFYSFPSNYRSFIKLERRFGTGRGALYQSLRVVNAEDADRYRTSSRTLLALPDSLTNYEQVVSVQDTQFRITPSPVNNGYVYRLYYMRASVDAADDNSNLDIPDEWREVIVLDAAIYVLAQTGDPIVTQLTPLFDKEYAALKSEYRRKLVGIDGIPTLDQM